MKDLNEKQKLLLRIVTSPIILIYLLCSTFCISIFLYPICLVISMSGFISFPFIYLLKLGGTNINYVFEDDKFNNYSCLFGYALLLIFPIVWIIIGMVMFIDKGEILSFSE